MKRSSQWTPEYAAEIGQRTIETIACGVRLKHDMSSLVHRQAQCAARVAIRLMHKESNPTRKYHPRFIKVAGTEKRASMKEIIESATSQAIKELETGNVYVGEFGEEIIKRAIATALETIAGKDKSE